VKDFISEKAVLSAICSYGIEAYNDVRDIIGPDCFYEFKHRCLFDCASKVLETQEKLDPIILRTTTLDSGVGQLIPDELIKELFTVRIEKESVRNLAKKLKKLSIIREACAVTKEAYDKLSGLSGNEDLDVILSHFEAPISNFSVGMDDNTVRLFENVEDHVEYLSGNPCDIVGISTSFRLVDKSLGGGIRRKSVSLWGSRTGVGKSIFTGEVARFNVKLGIPVLILDTEMNEDDQLNRSIAAISGVPIDKIETGDFAKIDHQLKAVQRAAKESKNLPLYYHSIAGKSFDEIISICRRWLFKHVGFTDGVMNDCLIIYDYFKLMDASHMQNMQETQALGFQISKMHDFCVKWDVPVLAFVQLNRDGIDREDLGVISQSDRLSWLASSVAIFKEKTEEEINEHGPQSGNLKFITCKTRHGAGLHKGDYIMMQRNGATASIKEIGLRSSLIKEKVHEEDF